MHKILSATLLDQNKYRGKVRDRLVRVYDRSGVVYVGARPEIVKIEMDKLFHDIKVLRARKLTTSEVFYYASMIHLTLVKIHPFAGPV